MLSRLKVHRNLWSYGSVNGSPQSSTLYRIVGIASISTNHLVRGSWNWMCTFFFKAQVLHIHERVLVMPTHQLFILEVDIHKLNPHCDEDRVEWDQGRLEVEGMNIHERWGWAKAQNVIWKWRAGWLVTWQVWWIKWHINVDWVRANKGKLIWCWRLAWSNWSRKIMVWKMWGGKLGQNVEFSLVFGAPFGGICNYIDFH